MAVSFSHIPANLRVPLFYAEISNELAGHLSMQQPACIIGPVTSSDPDILNTPILVSSPAMAYEVCGPGSVLADMVNTYRRNDSFGELWMIPTSSGPGATQATGEVRIIGTATAGGMIPFYIGGDLYRIGVAPGAPPDAMADLLAATINEDPFGLTTADATNGEITLTAKQAGTLGNGISLAVAWRGLAAGEELPPGVTVEIDPMANGAGIPDLRPALEALGDDVYDYIGCPWTDVASLNAIEEAMNDITGRWAWDRQVYGHVFTARNDTLGDLRAFGVTRNDPHATVHGVDGSLTPPWRRAAALTAEAATSLRIDPARPLQTLPLVGCMPPRRDKKFKIRDRQTLLFAGIAVEDEVDGQVRINRCITTYQRNAWGQPDPSYLDVETLATVQYFVRFLRQRIVQKFPRHKLVDDDTVVGPGQAAVSPRGIKGEVVVAYLDMVDAGIVENVDSFKELLIVERDAQDPNRVNILASPDLVNQLRVAGLLAAFRLRTASQALPLAA